MTLRSALGLALVLACGGDDSASTSASTSSASTMSASSASASPGSSTSGDPTTAAESECEAEVNDLYQRRIAPILATDRPKTCNTCHLSGVDLALFVQETPCRTMACLDARGLVDLKAPAESVILQWIDRADPASPLIDQAIIDEEHAAFLAWIEATAACGLCWAGDAPCGGALAAGCEGGEPEGPFVDPGGCDPQTREALFLHRVYAWRDRCYPCHFDDKADVGAPKWLATGPCAAASLATMHNVFELGLVDLKTPSASLLLLKPLALEVGGVEHGGDEKFHDLNDPAYLDFLSWIEREAECASNDVNP